MHTRRVTNPSGVAEADSLVLMVDGQAGLQPGDQEILDWLRHNHPNKPVILAVNKCESTTKADMQVRAPAAAVAKGPFAAREGAGSSGGRSSSLPAAAHAVVVQRAGASWGLPGRRLTTAPRTPTQAAEFWELGLQPHAVSAISGTGTGEMMDALVKTLPPPADAPHESEDDVPLAVAIVGRPNVGGRRAARGRGLAGAGWVLV